MAVIGAGGCGQGSEPARLAEEVGRRLAEAGVAVVSSGDVVIAIGGEWGTLSEIGLPARSAAPWSPCAAGS